MMFSDELYEALGDAQRLGFLGPRPIADVVDHANGFVEALADIDGRVIDLGSGGGVPGLVIAAARPDLELVLLDRRSKRTDFLFRVVRRLGWSTRVEVRQAEASTVVRAEAGRFSAAVARGFGPPRSTLAVGAALVCHGGRVVISEPPAGDRWDPDWLDDAAVERVSGPVGVACFERRGG